jgi:hypothetical protein
MVTLAIGRLDTSDCVGNLLSIAPSPNQLYGVYASYFSLETSSRMDWIDPRYVEVDDVSEMTKGKSKDKRKPRAKPFHSQVAAALAQPLEVWSAAYGHALMRIKWPTGCSLESTWLWSAIIEEQASVLVRAGMPANKLAWLLSEVELSEKPTKKTVPVEQDALARVIGLMDQSLETLAYQWLDSADSTASAALGVSAVAWHLAEHAQHPTANWLTQWLQDLVDRVAKYKADDEDAVLCHLVLQCELPLLVCMTTAGSKRVVQAEASNAMDNLALLLERGEDRPYPWLAHGATYLRASLASVLRSRVLADSLGLRKFFPPQQKALASLLKHAARWSRGDGTAMLGAPQNSPRSKSIWEAAVKLAGAPRQLTSALACVGIKTERQVDVADLTTSQLPAISYYCDQAGCAAMQSDWRQKGSRFAFDFSDNEIFIEALGPKGQPVLSGEWGVHVELNGQREMQLGDWEEVCWFTDKEVDYIEVEAKFGQHAKVQRQAMLFRKERLLVLADALIGTEDGQWLLRSSLPLAHGTRFEPAQKTREGFINLRGGQRCLALPLHLPEWRSQLAPGRFEVVEDQLNISAGTTMRRCFTPAVISLCNRHAKKAYTWRQLTVAQNLEVVQRDVAVAYRVQIDKDQWLIYRTLADAARRTALGMHTLSDFFAGRVKNNGDLDTLVEVEAANEEPVKEPVK